MIKEIQITLYDVFGYLIPGIVLAAALYILAWAFFFSERTLYVQQLLSDNWIVLLFASYVLGHLSQGLSNLLPSTLKIREEDILRGKTRSSISPAVVAKARARVGALLGVKPNEIGDKLLYQVCDRLLLQYGSTSDRDLYIYREGFYRGLSVTFPLLAAAVLVRLLRPPTLVSVSNTIESPSGLVLLCLCVLFLMATILCYGRYRRFGIYRIEEAIVSCFLLSGKLSKGPKGA